MHQIDAVRGEGMRITSLLVALMLVGGLYYWFVARHDAGTAAPEMAGAGDTVTHLRTDAAADTLPRATPVAVTVMSSTATDMAPVLTVRGRTEANRNIHVAAQTTGRVISAPLRRGARVSGGDLLCRLDPGVREAELAEAEAALAEALIEAEAASQLQKKGFTAETVMRARTARLEAAEARLDSVKWDIAQLEIRAPFDGILESDTAELGTLLKPGDICANVIDLGRVRVTGYVSEEAIDQLRLEQPTNIRLINGLRAQGSVTFLSRMADPQTRTFAVEATIDNPGWVIRDGMTAEIVIDLPAQRGHLLPHSALTLNDAGDMGVRIADDGVARFLAVDILDDEARGIWVAGLPGDVDVIVIGQEFVREGSYVEAFPADWMRTQP